MLTPISQSHLAALEAELLRVTAQRDALRDAVDELISEFDSINDSRDACKEGILPDTGGMAVARTALQSCQD